MKRLIKGILRAAWRATGPIRRPLARKFDARLSRIVEEATARAVAGQLPAAVAPVHAGLARIDAIFPALAGLEQAINMARCTSDALGADTNLVLDSVIREVARLQRQVEQLQDIALDRADGEHLSIVGGAEVA